MSYFTHKLRRGGMLMIMSYIWVGLIALSVIAALIFGTGSQLAAAIPQGAQSGITLAVSMAGSLCLWTGVGKVMEKHF